jgi:hypothetical protein
LTAHLQVEMSKFFEQHRHGISSFHFVYEAALARAFFLEARAAPTAT